MTITASEKEQRQYNRMKERCRSLHAKIEKLEEQNPVDEKQIAGCLTSLHAIEDLMDDIVIAATARLCDETGGWGDLNR